MCVLVLWLMHGMIVAHSTIKVNVTERNDQEEMNMSRKTVVITGSPRKNGNSFGMTGAFMRAAKTPVIPVPGETILTVKKS